MALSAINRWASDHTQVGGSWGVTWLEGRRKGNSARGPQHGLGCDQHKKQGCRCERRRLLPRLLLVLLQPRALAA
jgi:hypothetical protein